MACGVLYLRRPWRSFWWALHETANVAELGCKLPCCRFWSIGSRQGPSFRGDPSACCRLLTDAYTIGKAYFLAALKVTGLPTTIRSFYRLGQFGGSDSHRQTPFVEAKETGTSNSWGTKKPFKGNCAVCGA